MLDLTGLKMTRCWVKRNWAVTAFVAILKGQSRGVREDGLKIV
jgi:hypothetical protein